MRGYVKCEQWKQSVVRGTLSVSSGTECSEGGTLSVSSGTECSEGVR